MATEALNPFKIFSKFSNLGRLACLLPLPEKRCSANPGQTHTCRDASERHLMWKQGLSRGNRVEIMSLEWVLIERDSHPSNKGKLEHGDRRVQREDDVRRHGRASYDDRGRNRNEAAASLRECHGFLATTRTLKRRERFFPEPQRAGSCWHRLPAFRTMRY